MAAAHGEALQEVHCAKAQSKGCNLRNKTKDQNMESKALSRTKTSPIPVVRSTRRRDIRVLTSLPAGKMVPLAAFPLLREDALYSARARLSFEMMETVEMLMNAVNINVKAYFVPNLAFERFNGMDALNRAYEKEPYKDGEPVVPYIETMAFGAHGTNEIYKAMGLHGRPTQQVNTAYVEAYNAIWNFRAANRSPDINKRERLATTLAPAFWQHSQYAYIVPDFDQALMDGNVPLNVAAGKMPVRGIGRPNIAPQAGHINGQFFETGDKPGELPAHTVTYPHYVQGNDGNMRFRTSSTGVLDVYAELQDNGITVSLANIEAAKKTQAFARLRTQYTGHSEEYVINLLMNGLSIPDQMWQQPILLADKTTIFGMAKRYATDSGNLTESVVSGMSGVDLMLNMPQCPTGGVVMIIAEITPEQLFERQMDAYLHTTDVDNLPHYLRDELDPEKAEVVPNEFIDVDHDTPSATFGYAPLNYKWAHNAPNIGGRFYRPTVDAGFDEDRQRLWAVETDNPTLSEDFYLCTKMHTKPFVVTNQDPFEVVMRGEALITGNTVFGSPLFEASDDYEKIEAEAPMERIEK